MTTQMVVRIDPDLKDKVNNLAGLRERASAKLSGACSRNMSRIGTSARTSMICGCGSAISSVLMELSLKT